MTFDQLDQARHDASQATNRCRELEAVVAQLEDRSQRDRRLASEQREDLEAQIARLKQTLDQTNAQNVALHEDHNLVGQELAELSAKSAARIQVGLCASCCLTHTHTHTCKHTLVYPRQSWFIHCLIA
jgi:hypothetical protein